MARKQLKAALKDMLAAARAKRWKPGSHGKGGGGREVSESESDAESHGSRYTGTETGDAQVGK